MVARYKISLYICNQFHQVSQIVHLCGEGVLKPFCDLLAAKDDKTVGVVLDGVSNILATAEKLSEVDKVMKKF